MKKKFKAEGPKQGIDVRCPRCQGWFRATGNLGALLTSGDSRFEKAAVLPDVIECPRCLYQGK